MKLRLIFGSFLVWALAFAALGALGSCGSDDDGPGETPDDKCTLDSQCSGDTPYCGPADACVECVQNSQCTSADAPFCDTETFSCRGCNADSECASGVCLASLGTCAAADQLIYVKQDGVNNNTCDAAAPCATLDFAKNRVTAQRNVIRVQGNISQRAVLQGKIYVDGDGGTWTVGNGSLLEVGTAAGDVTIEGMTLQGQSIASTFPVVECLNSASLRVHQATIKLGALGITAVCKVAVTDSKIVETIGSVKCENNSLTIEDSELNSEDATAISSDKCAVRLARNTIISNPEGTNPLIRLTDPPQLTIENNLIWDKLTRTSTGISVTNAPAGGLIRFNTIVNTAPGAHTGDAVACAGTSVVTSNVLAWQFGSSLVGNACARRYNAFDANTPVGDGEGNQVGTMAKLFVDPAADFHLGAESPALNLADPAEKITVDLDGKLRPTTGRLDAGAYERP